jgi:hypothetical protein
MIGQVIPCAYVKCGKPFKKRYHQSLYCCPKCNYESKLLRERKRARDGHKRANRNRRPDPVSNPEGVMKPCLGPCGKMRLSLHPGDRVCSDCKLLNDSVTLINGECGI